MSSSLPAPEDAAHTSVLSQHGPVASDVVVEEGGKKNKIPRPPPRSKSASLLTQALATNYEEEETESNTAPALSSFPNVLAGQLQSQSSTTQHHEGNDHRPLGLDHNSVSSEERKMSTVVASTAEDLRAPNRYDFTIAPANFDLPDIGGSHPAFSSRHAITSSRGRGTSLERTEKERQVESPKEGPMLTNLGDTGFSGHVTPQSPVTPDLSMNPPTEGMRARYRSWRDARPPAAERAWSIGQHNSDDSGQVENSIKEALAGIEPNSRSRKASHSMRFFKEGLPEDKTKRKESKNRTSSRDVITQAKNGIVGETGKSKIGVEGTVASHGTASTVASPSPQELELKSTDGSSPRHEHPTTTPGYFDILPSPTPLSSDQVRTLPAQLLADIRKNHNLTPGARKGTSFSQSIPVTASEKFLPDATATDSIATQTQVGRGNLEEDSDNQQAKTDEDEDSGSETIFSAVFLPHQKSHEPTSIDDEEPGSLRRPSIPRFENKDTSDTQQWLEEHEVPSREIEERNLELQSKSKALPSPKILKSPDLYSEKEFFTPEVQRDVDGGKTPNHAKHTTGGEDSLPGAERESDITPRGSLINHFQSVLPRPQEPPVETKQPLDAIELIPYRHQVGGHTTMWRFSKRAVCKQLNNRENEFYEKVERLHPKLCRFLPRYIGVLNVSFLEKQRKKTTKKEGSEEKEPSETPVEPPTPSKPAIVNGSTSPSAVETRPRVISQSIQSSSVPIPTVTFAANRHIIPKSLLRPFGPFGEPHYRSKSDSEAPVPKAMKEVDPAPTDATSDRDFSSSANEVSAPNSRPTLDDKHSDSWGSTIKNKELRNKVFDEVFSRRPIAVQHHKKGLSSRRVLANRGAPPTLRASISENNLVSGQITAESSSQPVEESMRRRALKTATEMRKSSLASSMKPEASKEGDIDVDNGQGQEEIEDKTGTSAPEYDSKPSGDIQTGKHKRRYSSGGLRRKPTEVAEGRGNLKYFEEADDAGYKGDGEDDEVFTMDLEPPKAQLSQQVNDVTHKMDGADLSGGNATGTMLPAAPTNGPEATPSLDLPRPPNPKEAQTQQDARVVYFLLLEDLTAGMKKPCIMDLKMGTRQYGVDANEKKQRSQRQKCESTTSRELGVRVCGLQVWDAKSQTYIFQDKYFGRDLKAGQQFQDALQRFLYDGIDYSSALRRIPVILKKLAELEVLVATLNGYRFYAASLLMFYDGDDAEEGESDSAATERDLGRKKAEIDFKIADFANCVIKEDDLSGRACPPRHPDEPDRGFLRGLRSLRLYFKAIQQDLHRLEMGYARDETLHIDDAVQDVDGYDDQGEVSY